MTVPLRRLTTALALILSCGITGELVLGLASALWPAASVFVSHHRVADEALGWRLNPDHPDIDRWGFRNPEVPERADVVVLGDSQTYGYGVAPEAAWPRRLQARSGLSVYSVACSGYGPLHGLALWDSVAALRPRHVIAAVYAGNDLFDTFDLVYGRGQLQHLRSADEERRARIAELEARQPLHLRARRVTRMGRPTWPLRDALRDHSRLYNLARQMLGGSAALGGRQAGHWAAQVQRATSHADYLHAFDGGPGRRTVFTVPKRLLPQDLSDPRMAEGLDLTLRGLAEIARRGDRIGAQVSILWIPTKELVFAPAVPAPPPRLVRLIAAEDRVRQHVRTAAGELDVPFVDALPALRDCLTRGEQPYPLTADGHPNAEGYAEIAGAVHAGLSLSVGSL